jgi:hypothetical protein
MLGFGAAALCATVPAHAQSWNLINQSIALKSGESVELGQLYWVTNCRSLLKGPPEVTIMDGPPGVTAMVEEAMVMPRFQNCAKPVQGGKLKVKAGEIDDLSRTTMTLRIKYRTKDGDRDLSKTINVSLFP